MQGIETFVASRGGDLLRAAWTLTGDVHHAEDLLQTALAKSLGAYDRLGNDHKFEAYLRTTMYRTYVSWWRRLSWRSEIPSELTDDGGATAGDDSELRLDVVRALTTLPRMQRAVMTMRYVGGVDTSPCGAKSVQVEIGRHSQVSARHAHAPGRLLRCSGMPKSARL